MEEILVSRWEKMNITMNCLGFSLNPFFYDYKYLNVEAPGGIARRAPNQDREVVARVLKAFDRIGEDENEKAELRKQLAKFQNMQGMFGTTHARIDTTMMSPIFGGPIMVRKLELTENASNLLVVIQQRKCGALNLTFTTSKEID
ncbi:hypothetical protein V6N13_009240 [Hibiscus sabdariffa]